MNKFHFYEQVYKIVSSIPKGKVMSYGQIAALLGSPYYARRVGQAMFNVPNNRNIPWHRVLRSSGELSNENIRDIQKHLLLSEGIQFISDYKINIKKHINI